MKYIDEFRDGHIAGKIARRIREEAQPGLQYRFMEFCGGHTHAIARYGITDLLPDNVRMIHGPGCPVCVLPIGRIDQAIKLALEQNVMLCTYGDVMRVPASEQLSLIRARSQGADIRMVYSAADALSLARKHPDQQVVFLAIGFETTTPPTALVIKEAACENLKNFSVLCNHVLTPSAIAHILRSPDNMHLPGAEIDGFVGPAHVSIVIGYKPYEDFASQYEKPVVIAGFEPLDVMQAILMLVRQVNQGRHVVENEFTRAVTRDGNQKAQYVTRDVFDIRKVFEWRGLGDVEHSALRINDRFSVFDAECRFDLEYKFVPDHRKCDCGEILRGLKQPADCSLFATVCTPDNPMGSCMVSSEGACAAHFSYGRFRDIKIVDEAVS